MAQIMPSMKNCQVVKKKHNELKKCGAPGFFTDDQLKLLKSFIPTYRQTKVTQDWGSLWATIKTQIEEKWPMTLTEQDIENKITVTDKKMERQKVSACSPLTSKLLLTSDIRN